MKDSAIITSDGAGGPSGERETLWLLTLSPAIWTFYFLTGYIVAALWCGPPGESPRPVVPLQIGMAIGAAAAVLAIAFIGRKGWNMHRHPGGEAPHDDDTAEDRHRFLGYATLLLSALSAVATVFVAVSVLLSKSCF